MSEFTYCASWEDGGRFRFVSLTLDAETEQEALGTVRSLLNLERVPEARLELLAVTHEVAA